MAITLSWVGSPLSLPNKLTRQFSGSFLSTLVHWNKPKSIFSASWLTLSRNRSTFALKRAWSWSWQIFISASSSPESLLSYCAFSKCFLKSPALSSSQAILIASLRAWTPGLVDFCDRISGRTESFAFLASSLLASWAFFASCRICWACSLASFSFSRSIFLA